MAYIMIPLVTDPTVLLDEKIARFQQLVPGWVTYDGSPEVRLMRMQSVDDAVALDVVSQVSTGIVRYWGQTVDGEPFQDATYAQADAEFTLTATGFTIPAGLRLSIDAGGGSSITFAVASDVLADSTTMTVPIAAVEAGEAASGLLPGADVTLIDKRTWITGVELATETTGGRDAESDADYLSRYTKKRQRMSDTIVTGQDAQEAALEIAGIGRVLVLKRYVPASTAPGLTIGSGAPAPTGTAQTDVAGAVTFIPASDDGSDVPSLVKSALIALVNDDRLAQLAVYVIDPTRTNVTVSYKYTVDDGWDPTTVGTAGDAAVTAYMSAAQWGLVADPLGVTTWREDTIVRYGELYAVLNAVDGLDHVTELKINGVADTNATLAGPGALPNLTSVTGVFDG